MILIYYDYNTIITDCIHVIMLFCHCARLAVETGLDSICTACSVVFFSRPSGNQFCGGYLNIWHVSVWGIKTPQHPKTTSIYHILAGNQLDLYPCIVMLIRILTAIFQGDVFFSNPHPGCSYPVSSDQGPLRWTRSFVQKPRQLRGWGRWSSRWSWGFP